MLRNPLLVIAAASWTDDPSHAELLHRLDVGAVIQLTWKQMMIPPVSRQEHHFAPGDFTEQQFIGRLAKLRVHPDRLLPRQTLDLIQATTANDPDWLR
jgi:hypothetical protein